MTQQRSASNKFRFFAVLGSALIATTLSACAPDPGASSAKEITRFEFLAADNPQLAADVQGVITGTKIALTVPAATVVSALQPSIRYIGDQIEPAKDESQDFTDPVEYTIT